MVTEFDEGLVRVDALARGDAVLRARLETVADLAVRLVDGCDNASIALVLEGRSATIAVSDQVALEVDLVQYRSRQGPCLDAVAGDGQVIRIDLLDAGSTYARMAPGAVDAGVQSVLSIPFFDAGSVIGSLNLYSSRHHGFDAAAEAAAAPLAEAAAAVIAESTLLWAAKDLLGGIVLAMEDDTVTNQAVGLLMHQKGCTGEAARRLLAERARTDGTTVAAAAQAVLDDQPPAAGR